jgi:hypothetical protein
MPPPSLLKAALYEKFEEETEVDEITLLIKSPPPVAAALVLKVQLTMYIYSPKDTRAPPSVLHACKPISNTYSAMITHTSTVGVVSGQVGLL